MHARLDPDGAVAPPRWKRRALMLSVPLLLAAVGVWLWLSTRGTVTTDNAYVRQDKVAISSDVTSRVQEVLVGENQPVKRGQVLVRLVQEPFRIALAEAEARLGSARLDVAQRRSGTVGSIADVSGKREALVLARAELERQQRLMEQGFTTRARLQLAQFAAGNAAAELERALADEAQARTAANGVGSIASHPLVQTAQAARDQAKFNFDRTIIRSPADGIATQTTKILPGAVMVQGVPTLSVMVSKNAWVEANFKETDLEDMRVGQTAVVTLDAYPSRPITGRVESIGVGTGQEFSVLPAQNATGNWVKVVQRVPVRIALPANPDVPLIAGLSATVKVETR